MPTRRPAVRLVPFLALAWLVLLAAPLRAQLPRWDDTTRVPRSCLGPDGRLPQAPSLVHLVPDDAMLPWPALPEKAGRSADLAAEVVARYMRGLLGAADGDLPGLDTTRRIGDWSGYVTVIARRDGSMRAVMPWEDFPRRARDRMRPGFEGEGLTLLVRALDSASRTEPFTWPEKLEGDSIAFRLKFDWPRPDGAGRFERMQARHAAAVVPMLVPATRAARPARPIYYFQFRRWPGESRGERFTVDVMFELDSTGRVVPGSARDLWPIDEPRPTGRAARRYAEFVADVRKNLEDTAYIPARVGTCAVGAPMRERFTFAFQPS